MKNWFRLTGLSKVNAASFDGLTLVRIGITPNPKKFQPWIARLDPGTFVPEPSGFLLAVLGIVGIRAFLVGRYRRVGGNVGDGEKKFACARLFVASVERSEPNG